MSRPKLIMVLVMLVGMGAWGLYAGQDAQAGVSIPHLKCYETTGTPVNEPVRLFDVFHDGPPSPSAGGELVTVKGSHLICTQVFAKCFPDSGQCINLPIEFSQRSGVNCYKITPSGPPVGATVSVEDQLAEQDLKVQTPQFVCAPFSGFHEN